MISGCFRLLPAVENADNDSFRYAEIVVPQGFVAAYNDSRGIHVLIPYTPDTRHLMVRFVIESGSGEPNSSEMRSPANAGIR